MEFLHTGWGAAVTLGPLFLGILLLVAWVWWRRMSPVDRILREKVSYERLEDRAIRLASSNKVRDAEARDKRF